MLAGLALAMVLAGGGPALAQSLATSYPLDLCAGDRFGGKLNCTANDVQITNIKVNQGAATPSSCVGGGSVTLDLDVTVAFGSSTRYDVGIFLSQDGASPQELSTRTVAGGTGSTSCKVAILPSPAPPSTLLTAATPFPNIDAGPYTISGSTVYDTCGDGSSGTVGGGTGTGTFTITGVTVKCQAIDSSGALNIPFVVSWDQNSSPTGKVCTSAANPVPGAPSKCNAPAGVQGNVQVVTLPAISKTDFASTISPGDTTTYTVTVSNSTGVTLTSAVFKDPAVANLNVGSVACAAQGATCPTAAATTVAAMQGSGMAIPQMLAGGTVTFTVNAALTGNPTGALANVASVSIGTASVSASDSDTIVYPNLVNAKTVTVLDDPIHGSSNPLQIPGSESLYAITVTNMGLGRVDKDTVVVSDPIPPDTELFVGNLGGSPSGPVSFADSGSNLAFSFMSLASPTDSVDFSNDGGATWNYLPVADAFGYDAAVTNLRLRTTGRMAGWSGSGPYPAFSLAFKVRLD